MVVSQIDLALRRIEGGIAEIRYAQVGEIRKLRRWLCVVLFLLLLLLFLCIVKPHRVIWMRLKGWLKRLYPVPLSAFLAQQKPVASVEEKDTEPAPDEESEPDVPAVVATLATAEMHAFSADEAEDGQQEAEGEEKCYRVVAPGGSNSGPCTLGALRQLIGQGEVNSDTVLADEFGSLHRALNIKELQKPLLAAAADEEAAEQDV